MTNVGKIQESAKDIALPVKVADYAYLKRWLSTQEIREIREGNNEHGIILTRQQCLNIMKERSKNFVFRNILVQRARLNEALYFGQPLPQQPINQS